MDGNGATLIELESMLILSVRISENHHRVVPHCIALHNFQQSSNPIPALALKSTRIKCAMLR
jgi:hypothetical protein